MTTQLYIPDETQREATIAAVEAKALDLLTEYPADVAVEIAVQMVNREAFGRELVTIQREQRARQAPRPTCQHCGRTLYRGQFRKHGTAYECKAGSTCERKRHPGRWY